MNPSMTASDALTTADMRFCAAMGSTRENSFLLKPAGPRRMVTDSVPITPFR